MDITSERILTYLVPALRSGKYEQSSGVLRVDNPTCETSPVGFCCLGVAADMSSNGRWDHNLFHDPYTGETTGSYLTASLRAFFGMNSSGGFSFQIPDSQFTILNGSDPRLRDMDGVPAAILRHSALSLANLNDGGETFEAIADVIEFVIHTDNWSFQPYGENIYGHVPDAIFEQIEANIITRMDRLGIQPGSISRQEVLA